MAEGKESASAGYHEAGGSIVPVYKYQLSQTDPRDRIVL